MRVALPYAVIDQPGFAGPRTRWRGAHVATGETYEVVVRADEARIPADAVRVFTADHVRMELAFVASTAGATLGEIVDASAQQNARLDPGFASAILEPALAQILTPSTPREPQAAVSVDHVLVGFDGAVLFRGHLPWWGTRARPRAPFVSPDVNAETMLLVAEVLGSTLASRRVGFEEVGASLGASLGSSLAGVAGGVLRRVLGRALGEDSYGASGVDNPLSLLSLLSQLDQRGRASPAALGAMVQNLFAERHEAELRAREQLGLP